MSNVIAMTDEVLFQQAPSIFAEKPFIGMSDNYKFIPTIEVVNNMRENGFFPVMASQSKTRCSAKVGLTRHMLKFRQEQHIGAEAIVGAEVPEIILVNSHDGSSLYELMMGIFRFVCGNGMVVQASDFGSYSVKHNGLIDDLIDTTWKIVADFPKAFEQIEAMKLTGLDPIKQLQFAEKAMLIKAPENESGIAPNLLLVAKREDDETLEGSRDLWTTFNVIQENLIKGGLEGKTEKRKTRTRPIKAIQEDLRVNKALWTLANEQLIAA